MPADATGPGAPSGPLTTATAQATPDVSPTPAAPEAAKACDLAVGQVAISAALLFFTATALSAIAGRRRADGKRGAAHARTSGRQDENGNDALPPEIPADIGDPWIMGAPWSGRPDPARHGADQPWHDVQRPQHTDDYPSWPGRPGPYALHPDHPSWGGGRTDPRWDSTEAALRQDGYPSWPESAAPPWRDAEPPAANDVPAGAAAEHPRDKNRRPRRTAARTAGRLRAMLPGQARLPIQGSMPVPARFPRRTSFPARALLTRQATLRKASPLSRATRLVQGRLAQGRRPGPTSFPATDRRFSKGRPASWNGSARG